MHAPVRSMIAVLVLFASALAPVLASMGTAAARTEPSSHIATPCPVWAAHRGEGWPAPYTEDSRLAISAGLTDPQMAAVEDDAWPTADGKFLMMHSRTVDRDTDGAGPISSQTLAHWQASVHMTDGSVPMSLRDYLSLIKTTARGHAYLHVKSSADLPEMAAELNAAGVADYLRVMSGSQMVLATLHRLAPAYRLELADAGGSESDTAHYVDVARTLGQGRVMLAANSHLWGASTIRAYLAAGVTIEYITFGASQDRQAASFPPGTFARVLTDDVNRTAAAFECTA